MREYTTRRLVTDDGASLGAAPQAAQYVREESEERDEPREAQQVRRRDVHHLSSPKESIGAERNAKPPLPPMGKAIGKGVPCESCPCASARGGAVRHAGGVHALRVLSYCAHAFLRARLLWAANQRGASGGAYL